MPTAAFLNSVRHHIPEAYRGDRDFVDETLATAREAMDQLYHSVVVANGGDSDRAEQFLSQHEGDIRNLAVNLSILRRGTNVEESGNALREMLSGLERMGYTGGRVGLHQWLGNLLENNDHNNAVLRSAGFDVNRIRRGTETRQDDVQALIALLREQVELLRSQVQLLSGDRVRGAEPDAEAAARAVTGAPRATTTRTADNPQGAAPEGTVRLTDLAPNLIGRTR